MNVNFHFVVLNFSVVTTNSFPSLLQVPSYSYLTNKYSIVDSHIRVMVHVYTESVWPTVCDQMLCPLSEIGPHSVLCPLSLFGSHSVTRCYVN